MSLQPPHQFTPRHLIEEFTSVGVHFYIYSCVRQVLGCIFGKGIYCSSSHISRGPCIWCFARKMHALSPWKLHPLTWNIYEFHSGHKQSLARRELHRIRKLHNVHVRMNAWKLLHTLTTARSTEKFTYSDTGCEYKIYNCCKSFIGMVMQSDQEKDHLTYGMFWLACAKHAYFITFQPLAYQRW